MLTISAAGDAMGRHFMEKACMPSRLGHVNGVYPFRFTTCHPGNAAHSVAITAVTVIIAILFVTIAIIISITFTPGNTDAQQKRRGHLVTEKSLERERELTKRKKRGEGGGGEIP